MAFQSFQEILKLCEKENWEFWEAVARDDQNERGVPPDEAFEKMRRMWRVMVESSENYDSERRSNSALWEEMAAGCSDMHRTENL